jgi:putative component of membrane protein insertase Oxa1/YidC/SpoIIIJ protein YidD
MLMLVFKRTFSSFTCLLSATFFLIPIIFVLPVFAAEGQKETSTTSSSWSLPIKFFQKSISRADGDRCPMYPSCSHYVSKAFKRHGAVKGWILSCDRLLRCGHDEIRRSPKIKVKGKTRVFDPIEANTRWWSKDREKN